MTKRGARSLKELYDLTDRIEEPEITPVLEGSCRIQGPMDEPDHELLRTNSGTLLAEKQNTFVNETLHRIAESGTCNVCSAPCSSCMHLNQTASVMESNVDCLFPCNTLGRKEADSCYFIDVDRLPFYKSRTCDDNQRASSETSNLLSRSSSRDSYSENAESKATLRAYAAHGVSDTVDMPPKLSSGAEVGDNLLPEKVNVTAHSLFSSQSGIVSNVDSKTFLVQDEEQHGSECHGDSISCVTAVRDANAAIADHNVDLDKKYVSCSSASTNSLLAKGIDDVVQVEATCGFHGHEIEERQSNSRRPSTCCKKSLPKTSTGSNHANTGVSNKPELVESPLSKNIPSPEVQSPCSHPQQGYSFQKNADLKNLQGNPSSQIQVEPSKCSIENVESSLRGPLAAGSVNELKPTADPDYDESKASYIRSDNSSVAVKDTEPCLKTEVGLDGGISSDEVMKCSTVTEQFENSSPFMEASHMQGPQMQPQFNVDGENSGSDSGLDDVKVCDICGDAGREELLAICNRCSDGAEHTYCMGTMLDKLPEGDWLCEECKTKEKIELQKVDNSGIVSDNSKEACLNENSQNVISSFNPKLLPKLNTKVVDQARGILRGLQTPQISSTKHADNLVDASVTSKKASEASGSPTVTASPRRKTLFSRESSFKNLDMGKVKPVNMGSSSRGQTANNAPSFSRLQMPWGSNSFKGQTQLQTTRVPVSRSNSFNNLNLKRSPKVKQSTENAHCKLKPARESISGDSRKEGLVRTVTKSASFKSSSSDRAIVDSIGKKQPLNLLQSEDSSDLKQLRERNMVEKESSVQDHPLVSLSSLNNTNVPLSKMDLKLVQHDGKLKNASESKSPGINKISDEANNIGFKEVKKQSSYLSKDFGCKSCNGVCISVDKKPCQVPKDGVRASSSVIASSCTEADSVIQCRVTQAEESALRDKPKEATLCDGKTKESALRDKPKEATLSDGKTKESTLFSSSKQVVSCGNRILCCQRCNETGHSTQFCPIDKLTACALKPSIERNLKEVIKKNNNWINAVEKTSSKARVQKTSRLPDQSEEFQRPIADLSCEAASKDMLSTTSSCPGNLPFLEGTANDQEIARSPDSDPSKTTVTDTRQLAMHLVEPSHVSTASGSNIILTISDVSGVKSSLETLTDRASLIANSLRASAIPELEFIWQGGFEVLRTGGLPELFDGIQAHLSTCASPKVPEVVAKFPCKAQLEEVPCSSSWPLQFQGTSPREDNIALFFFAKDIESYEKNYSKLLENMLTNDLALRGNIDGVELLIFPSNRLPADSQCWNRLFFLWGVFRIRRTNCLESLPALQKKPCGLINADQLVLDLASPLSNEVLNSQMMDSCENRNMELSWCDRSSQPKEVISITNVNCRPISPSGSDDRTHNIEVPPFAGNPLCLAAADSKLPLECTSFPVSLSLKSMNQLPGSLDSCSESRFQLNPEMLCREGNNNATYLKSSVNASVGRKIAGPSSHVHANIVQTKFRALPPNADFVNCGQGAEDSRSKEKMREKVKSLRSEAALVDPKENPTGIGYLSWELRPSRKRAHSLSAEMVSLASSETSKSTDETELWEEKANCITIEDGREHKKVKHFGEGHPNGSFSDENSSSRSSSEVHPFLGSFLNEQQHRHDREVVMARSSTSAERCFFPINLDPVRDTRLDNVIHLPSADEHLLESNAPFLELAIGSKNKWGKQKELPLLFPLADENGCHDKLPTGPAASDDKQKMLPSLFPLDLNVCQDTPSGPATDDDASLTLSLSFTSTNDRPFLKTEQLMSDEPHINTSLLLYSGSCDI